MDGYVEGGREQEMKSGEGNNSLPFLPGGD